jgi:ATP-dependent RNA helicase RhlE
VAPEEEPDLKRIERAVGRRLPRVTVPDFDYRATPEGKLEVPIGERIAAIKARKAEERARGSRRPDRSRRPPR